MPAWPGLSSTGLLILFGRGPSYRLPATRPAFWPGPRLLAAGYPAAGAGYMYEETEREKKKQFSLGFFVRCGAGQASLGSPCQSRQPISPLWELTGKLVSHPLKETLGKGHVFRNQSSPGLWVTGSGCPGQLLKPGPRLPAAGYPASFSARAKVTGCWFPGRSPVFLLPQPPQQFFLLGVLMFFAYNLSF